MIDLKVLLTFITTFFIVSIIPGMCMTLSMSLGMSVGVRRTIWMILGSLLGITIITIASVIGISSIMLTHPYLFLIFKVIGGSYLIYLGVKIWFTKNEILDVDAPKNISKKSLMFQGFITAISNPKGWGFMITLLPPFIDIHKSVPIQLILLLSIILIIEFSCSLLYAQGGQKIIQFLKKNNNLEYLHRISGSIMILIGLWLMFF